MLLSVLIKNFAICEWYDLFNLQLAKYHYVLVYRNHHLLLELVDTIVRQSISYRVKVKVKVRVLSLDPKLALTTSQFYLPGHWKWPHSYILSFTGSEFNAPQGLHFLSAPH